MTGEWIRFGLSALCILSGTVTLLVSLLGLFRFDYALNRIHAAAIADTLALFLFLAGVIFAIGPRFVALKLFLVVVLQWCASPLISHMLAQFEYKLDRNLATHMELPEETEESEI